MVPPSRLTVEVALPSRFRAVFILSSSLTPATGSNQRDDKNQQEGDETEDLEGREIPSQHCKQLVHVFLLSCSGGIPPPPTIMVSVGGLTVNRLPVFSVAIQKVNGDS